MHLGDTIVACASPPGRSARALVRASGPAAFAAVAARLEGPAPAGRGVFPARFRIEPGSPPGLAGLAVLASRMPGPASYTGEDVVELQLPGNPALVDRVIGALLAWPGVRCAEPGEFSARAYLHGRLTLEQAEGVAATIAARTRGQLDAARRLLSGESGAQYRRWTSEVARLLALVEAGIDFTDQEDVTAIAPAELARALTAVRSEIAGILGGPLAGESRTGRPRTALAGAPNAGKSTLFNALLGRRRAVASPVAGTTRDALVETLDLSRDVPGAGEVELVDLAGLQAAIGAIEAGAQAAAARELEAAAVILHCDPEGRFEDVGVPKGGAVIRVRTKADSGGGGEGLAVCAIDGFGLAELRRRIATAAWGALDDVLVAAPRHRRSLLAAEEALARAGGAVDANARSLAAPEVVAGELRAGLDALGEITGRVSADEVIGRVFAAFCVGK